MSKLTYAELAARLIKNTTNHTYYDTKDIQRLFLVAAGFSGAKEECSRWNVDRMKSLEIHYKGSAGVMGELASAKSGQGGGEELRLWVVRRTQVPASDLEKLAGRGSENTGLSIVEAIFDSLRRIFGSVYPVQGELDDLDIGIGTRIASSGTHWGEDEMAYWVARGAAVKLKSDLDYSWSSLENTQTELAQAIARREKLQSEWHEVGAQLAALTVKLGKEEE
jgi:hypothetical protein